MNIFAYNLDLPFKLLLIAVVVIGLIAVLGAIRKPRLPMFVVPGLLLLAGWFFARSYVSRQAPVSIEATVERASFQPSADQLRHATVFPSIGQAAAQLTTRIADSLASLPEGRHEPARIALTVPPEIRPHVTAALRKAFPHARQSFDADGTTLPATADDATFRIELIPGPAVTSPLSPVPRHGALKAFAIGAAGTFDDSIQFIDKPWAADAGTGPLNVAGGAIVGRSYAPCASEVEALEQARNAAETEFRTLINERLADYGPGIVESSEPWFTNRISAALHRPGFIQDEFVQEMAMPYGSVFKAAVLVRSSPENIGILCAQLAGERRQHTVHTLSTAGAIGALSLLILLVYLFLNMVTRGYFTLRLRLAAVGLLVAAVLLVIMVA